MTRPELVGPSVASPGHGLPAAAGDGRRRRTIALAAPVALIASTYVAFQFAVDRLGDAHVGLVRRGSMGACRS
jgi:hypothetical protein